MRKIRISTHSVGILVLWAAFVLSCAPAVPSRQAGTAGPTPPASNSSAIPPATSAGMWWLDGPSKIGLAESPISWSEKPLPSEGNSASFVQIDTIVLTNVSTGVRQATSPLQFLDNTGESHRLYQLGMHLLFRQQMTPPWQRASPFTSSWCSRGSAIDRRCFSKRRPNTSGQIAKARREVKEG